MAILGMFGNIFFRTGRKRPNHLLLGERGERIAEDFLRRQHYRIIAKNVRIKHDEIDLIVVDPVDHFLVFIEVKTRAHWSEDFRPGVSAGFRKQKKIRRAMHFWIFQHRYDGPYRIDLIEVADGRVMHHTKAIGSFDL